MQYQLDDVVYTGRLTFLNADGDSESLSDHWAFASLGDRVSLGAKGLARGGLRSWTSADSRSA